MNDNSLVGDECDFITTTLKRATEISLMSPDARMKVGVIVVDQFGSFVSQGINSKPISSPNFAECVSQESGKSCEDLLHAEVRALLRSNGNAKNGTLFSTHCPCKRCVGVIAEMEIKKVYFINDHDDNEGKTLLEEYGISATQVKV